MNVHHLRVGFTCVLIISSMFLCYAQNDKTRAIKEQLLQEKSTRGKIDGYNNLAYEMRIFNTDSSMFYAGEALSMSEGENYPAGIAKAHLCIGLGHSMKAQYELSLSHIQQAAALAEKIHFDSLVAACDIAYAAYYYNKSNYDKAIGKSLSAIKSFEKQKNNPGIVRAKILMAQVYQLKGDLKKAEIILKEISVMPDSDPKTKVNILHTLANIYGMQGNYKAALALDKEAIDLCQQEKIEFLKSQLYDNMANCYMYDNRYDSAHKYFYASLAIDSAFENEKQMADTYLNLGMLSMMEKNYPGAVAYLQYSISLSKRTGYRQGTYQAYLILSDALKKTGASDAAILALKTGYQVKDSIINESTENKLAELETIYQTEKKEHQLILQKNELIKKNALLWVLGMATILIIAGGFWWYRKRQLKNKMQLQSELLHQQDLSTKAVIEAEEKERKRIAADLHDGVGQMMSAAKMNLSAFEEELQFAGEQQRNKFEKLISLVDESCKEIRSVSHQMMPNALLKASLAGAVKEFLDKIDHKRLQVTLHTEGLDEQTDKNIETVLYRVIQECVNNVLKHADAHHLDISLVKDGNGITATIEDDGKGFDMDRQDRSSGIGLANIQSRLTYLKGELDINSEPGRGTAVVIHVPVKDSGLTT
ncbi:MAG: hypothetical protein JWQ27_2752 [Ferruginibacter sp.]|nr:hypothetical protein [Ferruginibacter sp.]